MPQRVRVAFICTHNACRSQIAEAICRLRAADIIEPYSAGTDPAPSPDQQVLRLLASHGADTSRLSSKKLDAIPQPDIVVTMGCGVACPTLACAHREDWGLEDPTGKGDSAIEACIGVIEQKVDGLACRIRTEQLAYGESSPQDTPNIPDIAALRALADETRLAIVGILACEGELCACNLLEYLSIGQSTLSHHMKVLVQAHLVEQRKEGRWSHYRLDAAHFTGLGHTIAALGSCGGQRG